MMIDFSTGQLTLIDLDSYQRGAGVNTMGRVFGASRFMAPEEFQLGAPIDQRTTVYTLGRLVWHFATRLSERMDQFCGSDPVRGVVQRATNAERGTGLPPSSTSRRPGARLGNRAGRADACPAGEAGRTVGRVASVLEPGPDDDRQILQRYGDEAAPLGRFGCTRQRQATSCRWGVGRSLSP